jgi:RNA polymerase sigma-70 factor (ECF subfamily)
MLEKHPSDSPGLEYFGLTTRASRKYRDLSPEELVRACTSSGTEEAWEEFVRRFHKLVATVAFRVAGRWGPASRELVDELAQETYLKLCAGDCRVLRSFQPRHANSFFGFLKVLTANVVRDHFKSEHSAKRGGTKELSDELRESTMDTSVPKPAFETGEKRVLLRELDASLREIAQGPHSERDRRIFWLYYRVGLTAEAISALPSIDLSLKGVESTIFRLNRLIRERLVSQVSARPEAEGIRRSKSFS